MNQQVETVLNILYQRQITSREQLLREMLRVKMTVASLESGLPENKEKLFQTMKQCTEDDIGFIPADRDDFVEIFTALKDIDLIDFTLAIYRDDRVGTIFAPKSISALIAERIEELQPKTILITEAEKHLAGLRDIVERFSDREITLTTQLKSMHLLLQLALGHQPHITIRFTSIYTECLADQTFEYIHCLPTFGHRPEETSQKFFTRDSDGIAVENMLRHLNDHGTLDAIVPAKITFSGMGYEKLRSHIGKHFYVQSIFILPEGTFRPSTAIKTYFLSITTQKQLHVELGAFKSDLRERKTKVIKRDDLVAQEDWRIELLLADDNEYIQRFQQSNIEKVKLKEVAEIFRGKSILKKDMSSGRIFVLNLSNIQDGNINYKDMDTIEEEERKTKRYELFSGDVVLSCRGTAIKSAVFQCQDKVIIASANLIVIRPKHKVKGEYLRIFLESPVGQAMIKSFQRGTTVMNINHADVVEMEIPLLSMEKQQELVSKYLEDQGVYQNTIQEATERWSQTKKSIYNQLV